MDQLNNTLPMEAAAPETPAHPIAGEGGDTTPAAKAPDAGEQEEFEALIRGRWKEQFDQRVKKILDGRLRQLRRENQALRERQQRRQQQSAAMLTALQEAQPEIRRLYGQFDWRQALRDPDFARLIAAGVEPLTAYEVRHHKELLQRAMRYAASRSAAHAARTVESNRRRVPETGRRSAAVTRTDPRQLSSQDLADIRRRVQEGEKIRF